MVLLIGFAFIAGLLMILSPCILPVVPIVLATGNGGQRLRPLGIVTGLILSFTLAIFVLSSVIANLGLPSNILRWLAIIALALFGVALLFPFLGDRLATFFNHLVPSSLQHDRRNGLLSGFVVGIGLGLVWAPCVGPIMATVIVLAATQEVTLGIVAITLAFASGVSLPLLGIAYGGRSLTFWLRRNFGSAMGRVQQGLGALMIVTCVLIFTGQDLRLQAAAGELLPANWSTNLIGIENQPDVQHSLNALGTSANAPTVAPSATGMPAVSPVTVVSSTVPTVIFPTATATVKSGVPLQDLGPAPELTGTGRWYNSSPLTIASLRGKVVLVNFWTFECINCNNTLPYEKSWYSKYSDQGFVILGVHSPEFAFEADANNVASALKDKGILYPVVQDNQFQSWNAYHNLYWPAFYYIDAKGQIRYMHYGEGAYDEQEQVIQQLLKEAKNK